MDKETRKYLQDTDPNFKTYTLNKTIIGIPIARERGAVLQRIKEISKYVDSNCPLEFYEVMYEGEITKNGILACRDFRTEFRACKSFYDAMDLIQNVGEMTHRTEDVYGRYKICPCREVVVDRKFHPPFIGIFYKLKADSDKSDNEWNKYTPLDLILKPSFSEWTNITGPRKTDKLILQMDMACGENKREEVYRGILRELRSIT